MTPNAQPTQTRPAHQYSSAHASQKIWRNVLLDITRHVPTRTPWMGSNQASVKLILLSDAPADLIVQQEMHGSSSTVTGRAGTVSIVPSYETAQWTWNQPIELTTLHIPPERFAAVARQVFPDTRRRIVLEPILMREDPLVERLMLELREAMPSTDQATQIFIDATLSLLCVHLLQRYGTPTNEGREDGSGLSHSDVERLRQHIRGNLHTPLKLESLAAYVGLSTFHFARQFKKSTGQTPHQVVTELRLRDAQRRLCNTEEVIAEIATLVGFRSSSHFSRVFKQHLGMTPSAYRRTCKGNARRCVRRPSRWLQMLGSGGGRDGPAEVMIRFFDRALVRGCV